jgi:hypothetical protein
MSGSIMEFSSDIGDATAPPPLPIGPYPAEIIGAQRRTSSTSGNEYCQFSMRIAAEHYPADFTGGDPDGTVLSYNRLLMEDTPQARWRWKQFCERVGGPMGRQIDLNAFIGLTCVVDITHQEYEGEDRAQISRILAP